MSQTRYLYVSTPVNPAFGVYVITPVVELTETVPFVGWVTNWILAGSKVTPAFDP